MDVKEQSFIKVNGAAQTRIACISFKMPLIIVTGRHLVRSKMTHRKKKYLSHAKE